MLNLALSHAKNTMDEPKNTGQFGKGNPGKPKGAENKLNKEVKQMILDALEGAGGVEYLKRQAEEKPVAFMTLVGKVLPLQVNGAGENGEHLFQKIVREIVDPK